MEKLSMTIVRVIVKGKQALIRMYQNISLDGRQRLAYVNALQRLPFEISIGYNPFPHLK